MLSFCSRYLPHETIRAALESSVLQPPPAAVSSLYVLTLEFLQLIINSRELRFHFRVHRLERS
jgi:hypothetical protein